MEPARLPADRRFQVRRRPMGMAAMREDSEPRPSGQVCRAALGAIVAAESEASP